MATLFSIRITNLECIWERLDRSWVNVTCAQWGDHCNWTHHSREKEIEENRQQRAPSIAMTIVSWHWTTSMSFLCLVTAIIFERIHLIDWHSKTKKRFFFFVKMFWQKKSWKISNFPYQLPINQQNDNTGYFFVNDFAKVCTYSRDDLLYSCHPKHFFFFLKRGRVPTKMEDPCFWP